MVSVAGTKVGTVQTRFKVEDFYAKFMKDKTGSLLPKWEKKRWGEDGSPTIDEVRAQMGLTGMPAVSRPSGETDEQLRERITAQLRSRGESQSRDDMVDALAYGTELMTSSKLETTTGADLDAYAALLGSSSLRIPDGFMETVRRFDASAMTRPSGYAHGKDAAALVALWRQVRELKGDLVISTPRGNLQLSIQDQRDLIEVVRIFQEAKVPRTSQEWTEALVHVKGPTAMGQELDVLGNQFAWDLSRPVGQSDTYYRKRLMALMAGMGGSAELAHIISERLRCVSPLIQGVVVDPHPIGERSKLGVSIRVDPEATPALRLTASSEARARLDMHWGDMNAKLVTLPTWSSSPILPPAREHNEAENLEARCRRKVKERYGAERGEDDG